MNKQITELLEDVVERAWEEQKIFSKVIFGNLPKRNDSLCQGISRNIEHKIFGVFPNSGSLEFKVNGKSHIVVYIANVFNNKIIIDGAIKQFLPKEKRTVFNIKDYPFKVELQSAKRWYN